MIKTKIKYPKSGFREPEFRGWFSFNLLFCYVYYESNRFILIYSDLTMDKKNLIAYESMLIWWIISYIILYVIDHYCRDKKKYVNDKIKEKLISRIVKIWFWFICYLSYAIYFSYILLEKGHISNIGIIKSWMIALILNTGIGLFCSYFFTKSLIKKGNIFS